MASAVMNVMDDRGLPVAGETNARAGPNGLAADG